MKLLMALFFSLNLIANDQASPDTSAPPPTQNKDETSNNSLKRAMDIILEEQFASQAKGVCDKKQKANPSLNYGECIFENLGQDGQDKAYKILEELQAQEAKEKTKPILGESIATGTVEFYRDPTLNTFAERLSEQFEKAIYGELTAQQKKETLQVIDPSVFHRFYKSQLSKNLILNMTEFCIGVDLANRSLTKYEYKESNRDDNIKNLKTDPQMYSKSFQRCTVNISDVCTNLCTKGGSPCATNTDTQSMACQMQDMMVATKKNLMATDKILESWDEFDKKYRSAEGDLSRALEGQVVKLYQGAGDDKQKSIDELTSITSGQFEKLAEGEGTDPSGKKSDVYTDKAKMLEEKCKKSPDADECKFLKFDAEAKQAEINELELRNTLLAKRLEKDLDVSTKDGQKNLEAYLKQEGVEDAENIVKDPKKAKEIAEQIKKNYAERKQAVINKMRNRLKELSPSQDPNQNMETRINTVASELKKRKKEFSQLIHFSNIISGFFTIGDEGLNVDQNDQKKSSVRYNTAAAEREMAEVSGDIDKASQDAINQKIQAVSQDGQKVADEITLNVSKINEILLPPIREKKQKPGTAATP